MDNKEYIKIGSKVLNEEGIKSILKDVDKIFKFISNQKLNYKKNDGNSPYKNLNSEETNKDNVISIIGERGSGKTSVLKTVKYIIEELGDKKKNNEIIDKYKFLRFLDKNYSNSNEYKKQIDCDSCDLKEDCDLRHLKKVIEDINNCPLQQFINQKNEKAKNMECKINFENDIIIDIVKPEIFDQNDLLGFMIGYLKKHEKKVGEIWKNFSKSEKQEYYKHLYDKNEQKTTNCDSLSNPVKDKFNKLQRMYIKRREEYEELVREKGFESIDKYMDDITEVLYSDACIIKKFKDFIEQLIDFKEHISKENNTCIYMFFDDMDLCNNGHDRILKTILNFFMTDRIIVFISADIESLKSKLTLDYLNSENLLRRELLDIDFGNASQVEYSNYKKSVMKRYNTLAIDFINKIMSPKNRYYLSKLNKYEIINFQSNENKDEDENKNKDSNKFLKVINKLLKNNEFIDAYSFIFPKKPRGMINIYSALLELSSELSLMNSKCYKESDYKQRLMLLDNFFGVIINSNNDYLDYKNILENNRINDFNADFDYDYIYQIFKDKLEEIELRLKKKHNFENKEETTLTNEYKEEKIQIVKNTMQIFILFIFFENLKANIVSGKDFHNDSEYILKNMKIKTYLKEIINSINTTKFEESEFDIINDQMDIKDILRIYSLMFDKLYTMTNQNSLDLYLDILKNIDYENNKEKIETKIKDNNITSEDENNKTKNNKTKNNKTNVEELLKIYSIELFSEDIIWFEKIMNYILLKQGDTIDIILKDITPYVEVLGNNELYQLKNKLKHNDYKDVDNKEAANLYLETMNLLINKDTNETKNIEFLLNEQNDDIKIILNLLVAVYNLRKKYNSNDADVNRLREIFHNSGFKVNEDLINKKIKNEGQYDYCEYNIIHNNTDKNIKDLLKYIAKLNSNVENIFDCFYKYISDEIGFYLYDFSHLSKSILKENNKRQIEDFDRENINNIKILIKKQFDNNKIQNNLLSVNTFTEKNIDILFESIQLNINKIEILEKIINMSTNYIDNITPYEYEKKQYKKLIDLFRKSQDSSLDIDKTKEENRYLIYCQLKETIEYSIWILNNIYIDIENILDELSKRAVFRLNGLFDLFKENKEKLKDYLEDLKRKSNDIFAGFKEYELIENENSQINNILDKDSYYNKFNENKISNNFKDLYVFLNRKSTSKEELDNEENRDIINKLYNYRAKVQPFINRVVYDEKNEYIKIFDEIIKNKDVQMKAKLIKFIKDIRYKLISSGYAETEYREILNELELLTKEDSYYIKSLIEDLMKQYEVTVDEFDISYFENLTQLLYWIRIYVEKNRSQDKYMNTNYVDFIKSYIDKVDDTSKVATFYNTRVGV
ncbi:MAG: hypothetical protein N4A54_12150 [Peptostreptococcaceae bacterium]|jgi:energy-coupling factor transporter ATP-binding protein EcfA2|nr:hypothetical protein [Peptostreptococcaceae bacterium]